MKSREFQRCWQLRWCVAALAVPVLSCANVRVTSSPGGGPNETGVDAGSPRPPSGGAGDGAAGNGDSPLGGAATCVSETITAKRDPVDLLLLLDTSGSMSSVVDTGRSKWELAQQALASFIGQPGSSGLSVGLMVFPLNGADCTAASYSQALVGFGELPGHAGAVRDMLAMIRPGGGTPMGPAFQGGIATLRAYLQANPRRKGALVLVTDGVPEDCTPLNPRGLAGIAADGFTGAPSITTYAVGVFAKDEEAQGRPILEAITAMGGSAQPFIVDPTLGLDQKLLETLAAIGGVALPCSFPVPQPSTAAVDYAKVSVHFSSASDKEIPYVSGSTRCDAAQGGWYYDDRLPPSRIILCPQSCQSLKAVAGTKVDLRYGCKPIVIP